MKDNRTERNEKETTMALQFRATEHRTPHEALQHLDAAGHDVAFSVGGRLFSARRSEYDQVAERCQPTTWHDRDGLVISVPGRDG